LKDTHFSEILRNKVEHWYELLHGSDTNYPVVQMREIARRAQIHRLFNRIMKLRYLDDENTEVNYFLWSMLSEGYICCQIAAIRRMSETQKKEPERRITSLRALIDDIEHYTNKYPEIKSEEIITMYKRLGQDPNIKLIEEIQSNPEGYRTFKDHKDLSRKLNIIIDKLKECESVCVHMNKHIAHAASQESRKCMKSILRYGNLYEAEKLIWNAYNLLRCIMFRDKDPINTSYSFDIFQYLDVPLVKVNEMDTIRGIWREIQSDMNEWSKPL